jgi:hypothetical protein
MFLVSLPKVAGAACGVILSILVGCLTCFLSCYSRAFDFGWLWALMILIGTICSATGVLSPSTTVRWCTWLYVGGQSLTGFLLLVGLAAVALSSRERIDHRVASAAFLYFPLFAVSAVGALIWVVGLASLSNLAAKAFACWQRLYASALSEIGYNLRVIEYSFAALVGMVAVGLILIAGVYGFRARKQAVNNRENAGEFARTGARNVLAIGAFLYGLLWVLCLLSRPMFGRAPQDVSVLNVYAVSALRIVPYLLFAFGPLATFTGIVIDVLFYLAKSHKISTAGMLRDRFRTALMYAASDGAAIVVAAHSQGTVIAGDVLGQIQPNDPLPLLCFITAGSPLHSLYDRFLNSSLESRASPFAFQAPKCWLNFSREGDYIGADQGRKGTVCEEPLGRGGHTGYWKVVDLWIRAQEAVNKAIAQKMAK